MGADAGGFCATTGRRTTKLLLPNGGWHFWSRQADGLGYARDALQWLWIRGGAIRCWVLDLFRLRLDSAMSSRISRARVIRSSATARLSSGGNLREAPLE